MAQDKVVRYVITHQAEKGHRQLTFAQRGQYTYDTKEECETAMKQCMENGLGKVLNSHEIASLEVRPCECWPNHFDPVGIWFDD